MGYDNDPIELPPDRNNFQDIRDYDADPIIDPVFSRITNSPLVKTPKRLTKVITRKRRELIGKSDEILAREGNLTDLERLAANEIQHRPVPLQLQHTHGTWPSTTTLLQHSP